MWQGDVNKNPPPGFWCVGFYLCSSSNQSNELHSGSPTRTTLPMLFTSDWSLRHGRAVLGKYFSGHDARTAVLVKYFTYEQKGERSPANGRPGVHLTGALAWLAQAGEPGQSSLFTARCMGNPESLDLASFTSSPPLPSPFTSSLSLWALALIKHAQPPSFPEHHSLSLSL